MKNQLSNIALEGTCSGDVVGGLAMGRGCLGTFVEWKKETLGGGLQ